MRAKTPKQRKRLKLRRSTAQTLRRKLATIRMSCESNFIPPTASIISINSNISLNLINKKLKIIHSIWRTVKSKPFTLSLSILLSDSGLTKIKKRQISVIRFGLIYVVN